MSFKTARSFTMNGWRRVLGFHTDEYLHCAHREMVFTTAKEIGAAVFLQPVADLSHPGNLDYYTPIRCYQAFIDKFPANMIKLGAYPFRLPKSRAKGSALAGHHPQELRLTLSVKIFRRS